jgi:hypothetical protein
MRCPVCKGLEYEVVSPGMLRCVTERVVSAVPPGQGGNVGLSPIPLLGPCLAVSSEDEWRAAELDWQQKMAQRAAAEANYRAYQEAQRRLERRRVELLAELKRLGNPGLQRRNVPGRYHLSLTRKLLGQVGEHKLVEVEPAWPIGTFTWVWTGAYGVRNCEDLPTGYTPTERFVPMQYATKGDPVEMLYDKRHIDSVPEPTVSGVVNALERALNGARAA